MKSLGADIMIDYTDPNFTEKLEMYDVNFLAFDKCPFSTCNKSLNKNGVYINVTTPINSFEMIWTALSTNKKIIMAHSWPDKSEDLVFLKNLVETGVLKIIIDKTYALEQIVEAHRYVDKRHNVGNVVVAV